MSDLVGRLIHGRYQVNKLIARGGMATVYLAEDNRLDRKVALKVIHPHLANDPNFREKFVREAKLAARLSHPNLVNVFDQSEDDDIVFLAMEYVSGITLRQALDDFGSLTPSRALEVFEPIIAGLAAAHGAGILHRDIKPENVLLSDDGRIKLSDFGLARPISAQTQTGGVVGTVAYLSPELVSRGTADARSDVYAAGIMLFELLTGTQPFKGEQAVQVAMQHATSEVPAPSSVKANVPELLDEIVLWATSKLPQDRPADAIELHKVLVRAKNELKNPKTSAQLTQQLRNTNALRATSILPSMDTDHDKTIALGEMGTPVPSHGETIVLNLDSPQSEAQPRFASHRAIKLLVASTLVVLLGLGAGWWFSAGPGGFHLMPNLTSRTKTEAIDALADFKAKVQVIEESSKTVTNGLVISTSPSAGSIFWGGDITLNISTGPKLVSAPSLAGKTFVEATAEILKAGFRVGKVSSWFNSAPIGTVYAYDGSDGAKIAEASAIDLEISLGAIPVVSGLDQATAISVIEAAGLKVKTISQEYSNSVAKGQVISIIPLTEPLGKGGEVNLIASKGPDTVVMPKVVGETISASRSLLESLGLRVVVDTNQLSSNWGIAKVKKVSVSAGTKLHVGDTVTLISH
ncbi:MAG: hypothetical protein RL149_245 [Actinomycetota bacterium]|jgi:serine/threonine-protein kinase